MVHGSSRSYPKSELPLKAKELEQELAAIATSLTPYRAENRNVALAITKIEEAIHWLNHKVTSEVTPDTPPTQSSAPEPSTAEPSTIQPPAAAEPPTSTE